MKNYIPYLILIFLLSTGCSKMGYVKLNYPNAPIAVLPDEIHTIVIINRSLIPEESNNKKVFESITTGEVAGSDRLASDDCLKGVLDMAPQMRGITFVIPQEHRYFGTGTRETPQMLDWELVEDICKTNDADVLLVLETFDSNSDILLSTAVNQVNTILSGDTPKPTISNQVKMNVVTYWRLYDPVTRAIIDQYQHTSYMAFDLVGGVPPINALSETAYFAGQEYIYRFLPTYYTVRRDLYKKANGAGKHEFASGYRRAEVANWSEAMEIWKELVENGNRKTAGKAALNVAVSYEVLGDTEQALEWAQKSYQDYDEKLGRDYAKILLRRKKFEN